MENILFSTGHKVMFENMVKAENCKLYDQNGREYLDLESGVWCTSVGHSNPRITHVIHEQAKNLMHTGFTYYHPIIETAAQKILTITGLNNGKCVFLSSGSEAVELSVNVARSISQKPFLMTMKDSFLSSFGVTGQKTEKEWFLFDWLSNQNIEDIPFDKIAAFIFEPGSSSGHVRFPPNILIQQIVEKVKKNGGLVIVNEVTTGIGRTGKWFGHHYYDIKPDIVAMGKGLGNGYPVSSMAISKQVFNRLDLTKFHYFQSHQNDALGAAIANEVISIIQEDDLLNRAFTKGNEMIEQLNKIKQKRPDIIKEVRGRGFMIAIEFEKKENLSLAETIYNKLIERGIILVKRPGLELFRVDPALTIEDRDIDNFINSFEEIVTSI